MIKVLCASQAYDSLTGNVYRHHVLFQKDPENFKYVIWNKYDWEQWEEKKCEILRECPNFFLENMTREQKKKVLETTIGSNSF